MNKFAPALMVVLLVTGCTLHPQQSVTGNPPPPTVVQEKPASKFDAHIAQCRDELDAMQAYNVSTWQQYQQRFNRISGQLNKYLEIRGKIGNTIDDIAMPNYQYRLRNLCFDIRNELTRQIIKES